MKPNEWVAIITGIIGCITGVVSLGWNIYNKLSAGPQLRVQAYGNRVIMPPPPGNPYLLCITVQNIGTTTTTLTNLAFYSYKFSSKAVRKLKGDGFHAVANEFYGQKYPFPLKLNVGDEWRGSNEQEGTLDDLLMQDSLWVAVYHSFSDTPVQVKAVRGPRSRA
jgi:hypothetical protein